MENRYRKWYITIDLINSMLTVFDILHRYILVLRHAFIYNNAQWNLIVFEVDGTYSFKSN